MDVNSNPVGHAKPDGAFVDLERIVIRYAWRRFDRERPLKHRFLKLADVKFDISWNGVKFIHEEPDYKPKNPTETAKPKQLVLFKTQFDNKTAGDQNYNFKTERTTTSTITVETECGVTTGYELSLTLKLPGDIMEAGAGFKREKTITNRVSEVAEDTLLWGGDSQVKVKGHSRTTVKLVVDERCESRSYDILSHFYGPVNITLRKEKDDSIIKHYGNLIENIIEECGTSEEKKNLKIDKTKLIFPHTVISYHTKGTATFKFGAQQHVELEEEPLPSPTKEQGK